MTPEHRMPACSTAAPQSVGADLAYAGQAPEQWRDSTSAIAYAPLEESVILFGGLTVLQDRLVEAALRAFDGRYVALPNPDHEAFRIGKAYGNRGQCNPTYYTSGNLIKYLQAREKEGMSRDEIVRRYVFITASGCGPCRFGMYVTEYRKALRDAGFGGLRIESFEQQKGIFQSGIKQVVPLSPRFFISIAKAVVLGDIINLMGYQMRPYEIEPGSVDAAMDAARDLLADALANRRSLTRAMRRCRPLFARIRLDRSRRKPRAVVMGEFWAAMTEGDGNYGLHRFLEAEGAEVFPQLLVNRLLLSIWEAEYALDKRRLLPDPDRPRLDLSVPRERFLIRLARGAVRGFFSLYGHAIGLRDYRLPDMEKLYQLAKDYYPVDSDGGEGHMEVAHLIEVIEEDFAQLVISVKPFGCMPSSAVSDGIQSLVTARYPDANFLSIETSGEGAANFHSRVQMALFKAKEKVKAKK